MRIGIIGAGFTGLSAAHELSSNGHEVVVIEKDAIAGGLASGFKSPGWNWYLERYYHHVFSNDKAALDLAKLVGQEMMVIKPKTSYLINDNIFKFDGPTNLLQAPFLSYIEKIRMGVVIMLLKINGLWRPLELVSARRLFRMLMGRKAWNLFWEPLMNKKFSAYSNTIPSSWFWARIKKRTSSLSYPMGGFQLFANKIVAKTKQRGVKYVFNQEVISVINNNQRVTVKTKTGQEKQFDKIIITLPFSVITKLSNNFPATYITKMKRFRSMGVVELVLETTRKFFRDGTYWLNVNDPKNPMLAIIEHTNFIDRKYYSGNTILYIVTYLPKEHISFLRNKDELLLLYLPYLKKINHNFNKKN